MRDNVKCIVSVTSYGKRMSVAHKAWQNIINLPGYHFVLTLYKDDVPLITPELQKWIDEDLMELIVTDIDYKFHKKYIPLLDKYTDKYPIINIDDDVFYEPRTITSLYDGYLETPNCVICHLGKNYYFKNGKAVNYIHWPTHRSSIVRQDIMPVHSHGVLYPTGFKPLLDFGDNYLFSDDISLHASTIRQGLLVRVVRMSVKDNFESPITSTASWKKQRTLNASYANFYAEDLIKSKYDTSNIVSYLITKYKNPVLNNYPSIFKSPVRMKLYTKSTVPIAVPDWYRVHDNDIKHRELCWYKLVSRISVFKKHLEEHPYSDILLLDDSAKFSEGFDEKYKQLMPSISKWSLIQFNNLLSDEVKAVPINNISLDGILLIRNDVIKELVKLFDASLAQYRGQVNNINLRGSAFSIQDK